MKKLVLGLIAVLSFKAQANFNGDSQAYQIPVGSDFKELNGELAGKTIINLCKTLRCQSPIQITSIECRTPFRSKILRKMPICLVESDIGYFIVAVDYLGNINVVYNRWD